MVKFIPLDPNDVDNVRASHRGRVSYPILKSFMETGEPLVKMDRTGVQQSLQSLYSSLSAYIRSHDLPIKLFTRQGEIHLARLDLDAEGKPLQENNNIDTVWKRRETVSDGQAPAELLADIDSIPPVDAEEVDDRYGVERNLSTK
jgi:hypothetical protein